MTLKQFILALPEDGWQLLKGCLIRRKETDEEGPRCPIAYLSERVEKSLEDTLNPTDYDRIICAADNRINTPSIGRLRRVLLKRFKLERQDLLQNSLIAINARYANTLKKLAE